ncbi:MAG TPA: hypothetical protein VLB46_02430 [Pyrinomonadaceae bacterium]|nr:hypothetical protein [Pyrinomonadaceae bacterium]
MEIEIRIRNASEIDFDAVRVVFPDRDEARFGPIPKGTASDFKGTNRAYRYAEIHVNAGGREFTLQPYDYVGEQPLAPGRYSYVLGLDGNRLTIELEQEPRPAGPK